MVKSNAERHVYDFAQDTDDGTVHISMHRRHDGHVENVQISLSDAERLSSALNRCVERVKAFQTTDEVTE